MEVIYTLIYLYTRVKIFLTNLYGDHCLSAINIFKYFYQFVHFFWKSNLYIFRLICLSILPNPEKDWYVYWMLYQLYLVCTPSPQWGRYWSCLTVEIAIEKNPVKDNVALSNTKLLYETQNSYSRHDVSRR